MTLTRKLPDVFLADGPIAMVGTEDIEVLREAARKSGGRLSRLAGRNTQPEARFPQNVDDCEDAAIICASMGRRASGSIRPA